MVMRCLIKVFHFAVRLGVRVSIQSFGIVDEELAARKVKKWTNTAWRSGQNLFMLNEPQK